MVWLFTVLSYTRFHIEYHVSIAISRCDIALEHVLACSGATKVVRSRVGSLPCALLLGSNPLKN